ncbi:TolC family outer membrane protein [Sansalvadorimonas verongulae]|uniref:TolC family outer membrane protein n=1 Tax=Sansalvadorimonas verongulae TaxID=2172824 RepID=UPI0012BC99FC|nr:TolC family outer membrane protein [Sansalvadorimonas verongulae]MTI15074.1 hypothetical protein [Sansalvadorimonas verongulae]
MMASKRLLVGIGAAVMALSGTIQAQESADLLKVYELALKNDADLAAAQASFKASSESVNQSRALLLPSIGVQANTAYQRDWNVGQGATATSDYNHHGWGATLTQPLFNLSSWFNFERTGILTEQARQVLAVEQQSLIMRVSEAYFNVLRAEDALSTAQAEERAVQRQLEQTQQRFEVGLIAETDVLEARAAYDGARVARIQANNQVSVSLENLRTLTNVYIGDLVKLDKTMPVATPAPLVVEQWVNTSIAQNLTLKAAREGVSAAESQLKVSRSGHAPTLSFEASFNHDVRHSGDSGPDNKKNSTIYGLKASLPIFSGGGTSSKVRESGYRLEESQMKYDSSLRQVTANTRNLFNTVNADVERVDARCQGIVSASSALKATQSGYEVGTRNIVDVLDAQKSLYGAQRDYLNARYDFIINTLKLKQTAGTLSPQDLKDLNAWIRASKDDDLTPVCKKDA